MKLIIYDKIEWIGKGTEEDPRRPKLPEDMKILKYYIIKDKLYVEVE